MQENKKIRIGCASGFWGDTSTAAKQLVDKANLNYLVFDFLAEVTMSILARAKSKNPEMGYATDFVNHIKPILQDIQNQKIKVITNAGGINPDACKSVLQNEAQKLGIKLNIAVIKGDDIISKLTELQNQGIKEIDKDLPLPDSCLSINAYLGAPGIVKALDEGADIVITGRVVDSALVLAPLIHEFKWGESDYNLLSAGSLAGHIIECGAQCTGGNFTDWKKVKGFENMGFPFVDVFSNGEFIVSKPGGTGGLVTFGTVAEQLVYEIGDPAEYILPDVVCDFSEVIIKDLGSDQVLVSGAKGYPPTKYYKNSATYIDGYRSIGTLVIGGKDSIKKGQLIANAIIEKCSFIFKQNNLENFTDTSFDIIGSNSIYGPENNKTDTKEIVLRIVATHKNKEALIIFSKELAQAVTGMAAGVINYLGGRPKVSPSIHLFSFLLPKKQIEIKLKTENKTIPITVDTSRVYKKTQKYSPLIKQNEFIKKEYVTPLVNLAYARSGDKGNDANIGVIARKESYFHFIDSALDSSSVSQIFEHVVHGDVFKWILPGINGINFLLKNSLGGGGMASLNIDPQGKAYAQQLLEHPIPVTKEIFDEFKNNI
ncbi:MAG: terpene utilization protein AtuA [Candidatus Marinimicrobia bacterium]|nr:terpene utilization protein AtuA [Candidatus Neomarinimicrobiota bacterium]|tara:strand:+ start:333 stop:2129 length:1797 start_codon:yes stop_codon:yes gene_type:complete